MKSGLSLLRLAAPSSGRSIFIGDVHGCYAELAELLSRVGPVRGDAVVAVGDMVRKGPDPVRCLDLWQQQGYLSVIGNNEEKILRFASQPRLRQVFLAAEDAAVLHRKDLLEFLRTWPHVIEAGRGIAVVHGGLLPQMKLQEKEIERSTSDIVSLRWIRKEDGRWKPVEKNERTGDEVLWAEVWNGPETIVYGHTPLREPRVDRKAVGLDTGCVYGGWLTAGIYDGNWRFERVRARRQYAR